MIGAVVLTLLCWRLWMTGHRFLFGLLLVIAYVSP